MRSKAEAKLKPPVFKLEDNYFVVTIEHTPLARPEELVLDYLTVNEEITNKTARDLTGIDSENSMKSVFYSLRDSGHLEMIPGKAASKSAWRLTDSGKRLVRERAKAKEGENALAAAQTPDSLSQSVDSRTPQRQQPRRLTRAQRRGRR